MLQDIFFQEEMLSIKVLAMLCDMGLAKRYESSKLKVDGDMRLLASFRVHKEGVPLGDNTMEKE